MQDEMFGVESAGQLPALKDVTLLEHQSANYAPRTAVNARSADLTVAFACDFGTAGERLTKRMAEGRFVPVDLGEDLDAELVARRIISELQRVGGRRLNVAGNGIYTCSRHGLTQKVVNQRVYDVLAQVHRVLALECIQSGGQTGADVAGLVAGIALGIPVIGLWPKGFIQRDAAKRDCSRAPEVLETELRAWATEVVTTG